LVYDINIFFIFIFIGLEFIVLVKFNSEPKQHHLS